MTIPITVRKHEDNSDHVQNKPTLATPSSLELLLALFGKGLLLRLGRSLLDLCLHKFMVD
jgi:hypothetical protein